MKLFGYSDLYLIENGTISYADKNTILANVNVNTFAVNHILPVRASFFSLFFIEEGTIEIELDYNNHSIEKYCMLLILPEHLIQSINFSDDFKGRLMVVDQNYFSSIEKDNLRLHQPIYLNLRRFPALQLNEDEFAAIIHCFEGIKRKMARVNHHLKEALIKTLLTEILLEVDNILIDRSYNSNFQKISRQRTIVLKFFQLVKENIKVEHKVSFYAEKLHVTTQYLALIIKNETGKTTHDWIMIALLIEAKILLKHSEHSVQQVSDLLNFCDPSAFGKFFRTHTGITPFQYRKQIATY